MSRDVAALDPLSRLLLRLISRLPRGASRALNAWARIDSRLQDLARPLHHWPERDLRLDLRTTEGPQFFVHGCYPYQLGEDELSMRVLRPGDVVYDVGANIGYMTLMFLKEVGTEGRVHSFEPSRRSFAYLERNLLADDPVVLVPKAVGGEAGEVVFEEFERLNLSSVAGYGTAESQARRPASRYAVEIVTLDAYAHATDSRPCFVKIDVEGLEAEVFQGMRRLLADPAPIVLFEAVAPAELERCLEAVRGAGGAGYRFARIAHDGTLVALDRDQCATNNYFAIPEWALPRFEGVALPPP